MLSGLDDDPRPSSSVQSPRSEVKDRTLLLGRRSRAGDTGFGSTLCKAAAGGGTGRAWLTEHVAEDYLRTVDPCI